MDAVVAGGDLCEVATHVSHNWAAIEAYDATLRGRVCTELVPMDIPAVRHLFADNSFKEETYLPSDANLINRFNVICRFCLEEKDQSIYIFGLSDNAVATVESLVGVKIELDDMLPKQICADCHELINQCLAFKQKVASADTSLRRCIDQLKQVEIATKVGVETSAPETTEQHIFDADFAFNKLNEGHKFENLIEGEDYTAADEMVCVKDESLCSEFIEKPVEDDIDAIVDSLEGKSELMASSSCPSVNCEQRGNSHLQRHIKSHATTRIKSQSRKCSKSFCNETLNGHLSTHTTTKEDSEEQIEAFSFKNSTASFAKKHGPSTHGCINREDQTKPRQRSQSLSKLAGHLRMQEGEKPYQCLHCSKSFRQYSSIVRHVRIHTGEKPYKCFRCTKSFRASDTLADHVHTHADEKPYKCPHCSKSYTQSKTLVGHVRTHTGEKPYKCPHCFKSYSRSGALADHVRLHTGEKPFKCPNCFKSFDRPSKLANHLRTHTGEKPYNCHHCSKAFTSSSALANHARTHSGEK